MLFYRSLIIKLMKSQTKAICCNSSNDTEIIELALHYWYWPPTIHSHLERAQAAKSGKQAANVFSCFSAWTVNLGRNNEMALGDVVWRLSYAGARAVVI